MKLSSTITAFLCWSLSLHAAPRFENVTRPVILKDDGTYRMWYKSYRGISLAKSQEGISWEIVKSPVLSLQFPWSSEFESFWTASVILKDGLYRIYYTGSEAGLRPIHQQISKNGIDWQVAKKDPVLWPKKGRWDGKSLNSPYVLFARGKYWMWFRGAKSDSELDSQIGLAWSDDGDAWTEATSQPVFRVCVKATWCDKFVADPMVIEENGNFVMYFAGLSLKTNQKLNVHHAVDQIGFGKEIGVAFSRDGIHWTQYQSNPVLRLGPKGSWDAFKVDNPFVIREKSGYQMWYRGHDGHHRRIGLATSQDGIVWQKSDKNPVFGM